MTTYDFISGDDFRQSLQADDGEMRTALKSGSLKTVYVLAGSIVEAMLVDGLLGTDYEKKSGKKVLQLELGPLVTAAKDEGIITGATADLCSAVRQYRNLIHPGRAVRLKQSVSAEGANIAASLVDVIAQELAARKKDTYGYTAEQIVGKLEQDESALHILGDLLTSTKPAEVRRLLLKVLPAKYMEFDGLDPWDGGDFAGLLGRAYRIAHDLAQPEIKREVAQEFVRILKEEAGPIVFAHESAFFRARDLEHVPANEQQTVIRHLLGVLKRPSQELLRTAEGIGAYLTEKQSAELVDSCIRYLLADNTAARRAEVAEYLYQRWLETPTKNDAAYPSRLNVWKDTFGGSRQPDLAQWADRVRSRMLSIGLPPLEEPPTQNQPVARPRPRARARTPDSIDVDDIPF